VAVTLHAEISLGASSSAAVTDRVQVSMWFIFLTVAHSKLFQELLPGRKEEKIKRTANNDRVGKHFVFVGLIFSLVIT
jgi:hypothetical protein